MDILDDYLHWQQHQRHRTRDTLRVYKLILNHFFDDVVQGRYLDDVLVTDMEQWVQRERSGGPNGRTFKPPSAGTIARDVTIIRSLYEWAHSRGSIVRNPALQLHAPSPKNVDPRPISDELWLEWWGARLSVEVRALLVLGFFGGLRRAELASLHTNQIVFEPELRVVSFIRKGGGENTLPLGTGVDIIADTPKTAHLVPDKDHIYDTLRAVAHTTLSSGLVIPWLDQYTPQNAPQELGRLVDRVSKRRKLSRFTPHQLRHSCCTNLLRAGVPLPIVSRYMNHSDIQTTMRYYKDDLRDWFRTGDNGR